MKTKAQVISEINDMIENGATIASYEPLFKILAENTLLPGVMMSNDLFYRTRIYDGVMIDHVSKIKYPPTQFAKKGRLNDDGESIAYLSTHPIANFVEMAIGYYQLFCYATIKYEKKEITFQSVGYTNEPGKSTGAETNLFYAELLANKDKKVYNATIALGRHLLSVEGARVGILYTSVKQHKSNAPLVNIAVTPKDFDECFSIVEVIYGVLTYNQDRNEIIVEMVNLGRPDKSGAIHWQNSFDQMMENLSAIVKDDIFLLDGEIIHYKYGHGAIKADTGNSFSVFFEKHNRTEEINKNEIKNLQTSKGN